MIHGRDGKARALVAATCVALLFAVGCETNRGYNQQPMPDPLGTLSDPIWQIQELNAERADFIVYVHEFQRDTEFLNTGGEDHLKQIASRLMAGQDSQVILERTMMASRPDTEYQYPVNPDPELDMRRRDILVRCLGALGISDADQRVVIAPSFAQGIRGNEAEAAYENGLRGSEYGGSHGMGGLGGF